MVIPTSQVFAIDASDKTKQSFWISAWIVDKENIPHAELREIWFNEERKKIGDVSIYRHRPTYKSHVDDNSIKELEK